MTLVSVLDPLTDARWAELLERHPSASVFHSPGWLEALRRTYGYEPLVLTTSEGALLANGLAVCRVRRFPSARLVSLPFSDHCEPLVDRPEDLEAILGFLAAEAPFNRHGSLELRPRRSAPDALTPGRRYCLHTLDLTPPLATIFDGFHRSSTQRAIRRAEREDVRYEVGTAPPAIEAFYRLLRLARRRHGLPPQPLEWFRNLVACMGSRLAIHLAHKDGVPVAGILTLSFKKAIVYKYGGSDAARHHLGIVPFLFWRVIQAAKSQGFEQLDLGRSDVDQPGLVAFKDHLGATRASLTYYTSAPRGRSVLRDGPISRAARRLVAHLPDSALDLTGRLLYKHLG